MEITDAGWLQVFYDYYMLHTPSYTERPCPGGYDPVGNLLKTRTTESPIVCIVCVFIWQSVFMAANMAFLINVIIYSSITCMPTTLALLDYSYFASPDCLVIEGWIRATVVFPYLINLTDTNVCMYVKIFS